MEPPKKRQRTLPAPLSERYLDTVDRKRLDFDFDKLCSVSLSSVNVYCCLVCGRYLQGRSSSSPAYLHAVGEGHHIFIGLSSGRVFCLPENYIVESGTLDDIRYALDPTYTKQAVLELDSAQEAHDLSGNAYFAGFVGLNNIKHNDYANVIIQMLSHIRPIRDHYLLFSGTKDQLQRRFSIILKKLWSSRLFKSHVSPHELLQFITVSSNNQFTVNEQKDPRNFAIWLINQLYKVEKHTDGSSIMSKAIQGKLKISSQKLQITENEVERITEFTGSKEVIETTTKFWILTLDLPSVPLFKDGFDVQQLPQVKLTQLLAKYNGEKSSTSHKEIRKYKIVKYPPYLILHFNRFRDVHLGIELDVKSRNQTIVEFPQEIGFENDKVKYRLISNIINDIDQSHIEFNDGNKHLNNWKIQLKNKSKWIEIENLIIKEKEEQLLFLNETHLQVWERIT